MPIITTSGTYSYSQTVGQLVTAALRLCQVVGDEETPTASQMQTGLDAMAAMTKAWQGSGIHVWCEEEAILFLQPGQPFYYIGLGSGDHAALYHEVSFAQLNVGAAASATAIDLVNVLGITAGDHVGIQLDAGTNFWTTVNGAPSGNHVVLTTALPSAAKAGALVFGYTHDLYRPLRVMGGRRYQYSTALDIPIQMWARLDYQAQPNKTTAGVMTAFFYDPQTGQGAYSTPYGQMNTWPNPSDYIYGMRFTAQRPIQDVGNLTRLPDFPIEWNACLKWNLANELGPEFGVPTDQMTTITTAAVKYFDMASRWDRESESLRFGVAMQPGYRRG